MKIRLLAVSAAAALSLAACNGADERDETEATLGAADSSEDDEALAAMYYREGITGDFSAPRYMQLEVTLDSLGFSPGVIDGEMDMGTENALRAFQEKERLEVTGDYDSATQTAMKPHLISSATRVVPVPESWAEASYRPVPEDAAEQADMDRIGYESLWERLAERFHTTPEVLYALNPELCSSPQGKVARTGDGSENEQPQSPESESAKCSVTGNMAGHDVRVPNIVDGPVDRAALNDDDWANTLASLGVRGEQSQAARIVVDKSDGMLRAFDGEGTLIAAYTVTSGSEHDPLPLGEWKINGISYNPEFSYDPKLFWDVPDSNSEQQLPPGPNGPVGVVWIDLSKEHYGIHGTSAPETIGTAQSHGCVRLTNWDAAELAQMVDQSTEVVFQT